MEIKELKKAIEEHGPGDGDWRGKLLAGLQEEKNQLRAEQQQRELQQQPQTGECCASRLSSLFPVTVQGDPCGEFVTCASLLTAVLCFVRFLFVHQGRPQSGASSHR